MLKRKAHGFTLIEAMVSLTIMVVLLMMAAPSFSTFLQNRRIRTTAEAVMDGIHMAKAEAVRRNATMNLALDALGGWTVGCATPVAVTCPVTIDERPSSAGSANVVTTAVPVLTFNGYGVATSLLAGASLTIDITHATEACESNAAPNGKRCLKIMVLASGQARMCDPRLTTVNPSSPQAC